MIISENERNLETKEFEEWSKDYDEIPDVDLLKMKKLLEKPLVRCEIKENCTSYYLSGQYCRCARTLFPHQSHYEVYKKLLDEKAKATLITCLNKSND